METTNRSLIIVFAYTVQQRPMHLQRCLLRIQRVLHLGRMPLQIRLCFSDQQRTKLLQTGSLLGS